MTDEELRELAIACVAMTPKGESFDVAVARTFGALSAVVGATVTDTTKACAALCEKYSETLSKKALEGSDANGTHQTGRARAAWECAELIRASLKS